MNKIYFATNRRPVPKEKPKKFTGDFHQDGISCIRFGSASLKDKRVQLKVSPEKLVLNADKSQLDNEKTKLGSKLIFDALRSEMAESCRDVLFFVHGYNVSFNDAVKDALILSEKYKSANNGKGLLIALFSWPSDGSMAPWYAYANDRKDAAASGAALARALLKFTDFLSDLPQDLHCGRSVHLLAHSMGNYVLRHALQEFISQRSDRIPRIFDQIFLMAADEDSNAFEYDYKLKLLPKLGKRINVYFNRNDRAMTVSDFTKSNPDRLGDDGPNLPFQVPAKVTQIDCTSVIEGMIEHSYYKNTQEVVDDIIHVINGIEPENIPNRIFLDDRNRFVIKFP